MLRSSSHLSNSTSSSSSDNDSESVISEIIYCLLFKYKFNWMFYFYLQDNAGDIQEPLIHDGMTPSFQQIKQKTFSKYEVSYYS